MAEKKDSKAKAKNVTDKVKKKETPRTSRAERGMDTLAGGQGKTGEEKAFKEGFEDPMNERVKAGKFNPQGMGPRKSWEGPDKTVAPSPAGKAGPLPRSPSSVGLPKIPRTSRAERGMDTLAGGQGRAPSTVGLPPIPRRPELGSTMAPSRSGALEFPVKPMNLPQARPGISREVYQTDASTPPMRIPGKPPVGVMPPAPTAPVPDYLNVFRQPQPSVTQQSLPQPPNSMMGAGMGASGLGATMDNAWNPNAASDRYNESSDANMASQNMEKSAWFNSMTPEQQAEHLRMFRNR